MISGQDMFNCCIVCDHLAGAPDDPSKPRVEHVQSDMDLIGVFSKYFGLSEDERENVEKSLSMGLFPFCTQCRRILKELSDFHEQLNNINNGITHCISQISSIIIQMVRKSQEVEEPAQPGIQNLLLTMRKNIYNRKLTTLSFSLCILYVFSI